MKITTKHIASFVLLTTVLALPQVAFGLTNAGGWSDGLKNGQTGGVSTLTPTDIITNIINYALAIIGFLGVLGFIISGILYLVAAGDEGRAEKAKGTMINSIIGVVVALLGFVVMKAISTLLGAGGATNGL